MAMRNGWVTVALGSVLALALPPSASAPDGRTVYESACAACHGAGVMGAPKLGSSADWAPRIEAGAAALYRSALLGTAKGMPPKGGRADLSDADVKAAVDFMLAQAGTGAAGSPQPAARDERTGAAAPKQDTRAAPATAQPAQVSVAEVNAFNRLLKPPGKRNLPPPEDGIHDPANDGTHALQPPLQAFSGLPRSAAGNRVNWVTALGEGKIAPRWDRLDAQSEPVVMDLNIVRKVKGSMPDVVYPHKQHTEWLDCSNCHPALFVPQAGANQISMAAILLGQKCGVCHGKVAFPVSECRLCHSKKKEASATAAQAAKP
jgi:c(7)-type cytochrome triheme protein